MTLSGEVENYPGFENISGFDLSANFHQHAVSYGLERISIEVTGIDSGLDFHLINLDYDLTTGLRFHPIEIVISMGIKLMMVATLGPPVLSVLIFEVTLNATSMFNHSNIRIPVSVDRH